MDSKLQDLTEKIYREGVEKGERQATEIIAAAEKQAAAMLETARREADKIIAGSQKKAADFRQNMEADLRLASTQAMNALKQQILEAVTARVIAAPPTASLADPATVTELLKIILQSWASSGGPSAGIDVLLPEAQRERLDAALQAALGRELAAGLALRFTKNVKAGFQIQASGSAYKISLTDEDFAEYFKEYLRPKMRAFLFGA